MFPDSPLLDTTLADEFFVCRSDAERAELREIFDAFVTDTTIRLNALRDTAAAAGEAAAKRELHTLRGAIANLGLQRTAERLRELETHWATLPAAARSDGLAAAAADLARGLAELRARYGYLDSPN